MKHAFLIIAHNEYELLKLNLRLLDHEDHGIYVHVDKKITNWDFEGLKNTVQKAHIEIWNEYAVAWGDITLVQCPLFLLKQAIAKNYDYYHFLSGVDLPIKTNEQIHAFFEENKGKEFIHFDKPQVEEHILDRVRYRHYHTEKLKASKSKLVTKARFLMDDLLVKVQKIFKKQKKLAYDVIQKGCNWSSITHSFAVYVLGQEPSILDLLEDSLIGDEIFIQTVCINSPYKENLYDKNFDDNYRACCRLIIWDENHKYTPKTFTQEDWDLLKNSECLFARKFSYDKEPEFVLKWAEYLSREKE